MVYKNVRCYFLMFSAAFMACTHTSERLEQSLQSWVGKHPDTLVERWGAPASVYVMEKGSKVLSFEASEVNSRTLGYYRRSEIYTSTENCKVSFFTDTSQKSIEKFTYQGNPGACYDLVRAAPTP